MFLEVFRRSNYDTFIVSELYSDQTGVGQISNPDRNVNAFTNQVNHAIIETQGERDVAMLCQK